MPSQFPDGSDPRGFAHFDLWFTTWRAAESHQSIVVNSLHGAYVDPQYFVDARTDHLIWLFGWSGRPAIVELDEEQLVVPTLIEALVGTDSGFWIAMEIECLGAFIPEQPVIVRQVNIMGDASPGQVGNDDTPRNLDVSQHPRFPLRRWAAEAVREANRLLAEGIEPPDGTRETRFRQRSNSPSVDQLERVVELRERDGLSFKAIGERLESSEATASRHYKRAKAQGL